MPESSSPSQPSDSGPLVRVANPDTGFHGMTGHVIREVWVEIDGQGPIRFDAWELEAAPETGERP